jgi:rhamnulokinase
MGNALVQAMALGQVRDLAHLRRVVANSTELAVLEPSSDSWDNAVKRFRKVAVT